MLRTARLALVALLAPAVLVAVVVAGTGAATAAPAASRARATVSPSPNAGYAESTTEISFRGLPAGAVNRITVSGSKTGSHPGRVVRHSDGRGASFIPTHPFRQGETVSVTAPFDIFGGVGGRYHFTVGSGTGTRAQPIPVAKATLSAQSFHSAPDLHPPVVTTVSSTSVTDGDLFTAPFGIQGLAGGEITDPAGQVVYYAPQDKTVINFRTQTYLGRPVLTWWEGSVVLPGYGVGQFVIADTSYHVIKRFSAGNGLSGDNHEFLITPQNTALITSYAPVEADTSSVKLGAKNGAVLDSVVQELDLATGRVEFEWHALDHVALTDSYQPVTAAGVPWDDTHVNSIQPYGAGELLVSLRNDHDLVTISRTTGAVSRRIGGRTSTVKLPGNATFHSQHDAEPHTDGTITLFDNGAGSGANMHSTSRGLVIRVNGSSASLVRTLGAPDAQLAYSQGNVQTLSDGYLVDFGATGSIVEYDGKGGVRSDVHYQRLVETYRAFKSAWHASPTTAPAIASQPAATGSTTWVSWNGATEVTSWRVLAGSSAATLAPVTTVARSGFETTIPTASTGGVEVVQALDVNGNVLGTTPLHTLA